ncbi:MAG: ATP-binding protein, partial [Curvibacter sp.]
MPITPVPPEDLRLSIDAGTLGFADTSELLDQPLPWIGQERAEQAARFGLQMDAPDYNLFVLGEVGSGRSTLLTQMMREVAAARPVPPDLCYLHNFDTPEHPRALRMPPGQGRQLRQLMAQLVKTLQTEIPRRLSGEDFRTESDRLQKAYKAEDGLAYAELDAYAEARSFALIRDEGHLVLTLRDEQGQPMTEAKVLAQPKERRAEVDRLEEELRGEITRYLEKTRALERVLNEGLAALRRQVIKPLLEHELQEIRNELRKQIKDTVKLGSYLDQVAHDVLENLELFQPGSGDEDGLRAAALTEVLARYHVNLVVDQHGRAGAPVIVEDNPLFRTLFGSIEYQNENDVLVTDHTRIRAGSLLRAHGGFLMLHLRDLLADEPV